MKFLRAALIVSLIANLIFGTLMVFSSRTVPRANGPGTEIAFQSGRQSTNDARGLRVAEWDSFAGDDLAGVVEQLRKNRFPPSVIRAIVATLLNEKFNAKRRVLLAKLGEVPYWKNEGSGFDFETRRALRELSRERTETMNALLGKDAVAERTADSIYGKRFGNLPPEKTLALQSLITDYADMRSLLRDEMGGVMLQSDRAKMTLLDQEERADLAALLTPDELTDYEMRSSKTAVELRGTLSLFNPTQEEFLGIFKLQHAFALEHGPAGGPISKADGARRDSANQALQSQIKNLLGPERYAEYQISSDPASQLTNRLLARFGLSIAAAQQAKAVQEEVVQNVRALEASRPPLNQLNSSLETMAKQTETKLKGILGPEAYEAYRQTNAVWLNQLQPRVPRNPASRAPKS